MERHLTNKDIGVLAGDIWQVLKKNGEVAISKLPKMLEESDAMAYQALGWLAREGKIEYRSEGRATFVSLVK
ncbi:winged helix-turn-helix domain-containing protein [bacterium]|nr:winged helix-turn-helix domain-containing protein [bacterium]